MKRNSLQEGIGAKKFRCQVNKQPEILLRIERCSLLLSISLIDAHIYEIQHSIHVLRKHKKNQDQIQLLKITMGDKQEQAASFEPRSSHTLSILQIAY